MTAGDWEEGPFIFPRAGGELRAGSPEGTLPRGQEGTEAVQTEGAANS